MNEEVGEDYTEEGVIVFSDDEEFHSKYLEEDILPLSQDSTDEFNRIQENDWELNELEIEEEVESEDEGRDCRLTLMDDEMLDAYDTEVEVEEDELLPMEEKEDGSDQQQQQQFSIDFSNSRDALELLGDQDDRKMCSQDDHIASPIPATPMLSTTSNASSFVQPTNFCTTPSISTSNNLQRIFQSYFYEALLVPAFLEDSFTLSPLNSPTIRRTLLSTSLPPPLPLSTDRTNLFERQGLEEEEEEDDEVFINSGSNLAPKNFFSIETASDNLLLKRTSPSTSTLISDLQSLTNGASKKRSKRSKVGPVSMVSNSKISNNSRSTEEELPIKRKRKKVKLTEELPLPTAQASLAPSSTTALIHLSVSESAIEPASEPSPELAAGLASPTPLDDDSSTSFRVVDPLQAEMDAFFGYIDPHPAVILPELIPREPSAVFELPSLATLTSKLDVSLEIQELEEHDKYKSEQAEKGKGEAVVREGEGDQDPVELDEVGGENGVAKVVESYYQLQPIPTVSTQTGLPLTEEEKRLAIIESLEQLTLSILTQLITTAIPPSLDSSTTNTPTQESLDHALELNIPLNQDSQSQSQSQSQVQLKSKPKKGRRIVAAWKPSPVIVILANRVKGTAYDPTNNDSIKSKRVVFPRKNFTECGSPALGRLLKVIELMLDGLKRKVISTKRDLYYRSVKLFGNQTRVDTLVEDLAATLRVRRCDLNIVAASKGLFGGFIKILGIDGVLREGGDQGALIPPAQAIQDIELKDIDWVLIIEKEAVFQSLCCSAFLEETPNLGRGVLLTGKGYPDVATRELVHNISSLHPTIPLLCLVDSDPHGLEILSTYKFGSASLAFDNLNLASPTIEWLGIKSTEWSELGIDRDELIGLSKGDRKKALAMLKREWIPLKWKKELEYMLHIGRKAEIQVLSSAVAASTSTLKTSSNQVVDTPSLDDFLAEMLYGELIPSNELEGEEEGEGGGGGKGSRLFEYVARKIIARIA